MTAIPFADNFNRDKLGDHWYSAVQNWWIEKGQIFSPSATNNCLWLNAELPDPVMITMDARSESMSGDIKFLIFGNGRDFDSGYSFIFGGWENSISIISRMDEHGSDRKEKREKKVEINRTYQMKVIKKGGSIKWWIDNQLFMDYHDSQPLFGPDHNRFAFCNWKSHLYFDNLQIRPLE